MQRYMFITTTPHQYFIEDYTKYITTLEGIADMFMDENFLEDCIYDCFEEITSYSLQYYPTHDTVKLLITGKDRCGDIETIERGLIPVKSFGGRV